MCLLHMACAHQSDHTVPTSAYSSYIAMKNLLVPEEKPGSPVLIPLSIASKDPRPCLPLWEGSVPQPSSPCSCQHRSHFVTQFQLSAPAWHLRAANTGDTEFGVQVGFEPFSVTCSPVTLAKYLELWEVPLLRGRSRWHLGIVSSRSCSTVSHAASSAPRLASQGLLMHVAT